MNLQVIAFLCFALCSQVNGLPTGRDPGYSASSFPRAYAYDPDGAAKYERYDAEPVRARYVANPRLGGPIAACIQNILDTVATAVGDGGRILVDAFGNALAGAVQFGRDILDFKKPIALGPTGRPTSRILTANSVSGLTEEERSTK